MPAGRIFAGSKVGVSGIVTISGTVDGTFAGGTQYVIGETSGGSTRTGTVFIGINGTTARGIKVDTDGTVFVSGGGGGTQYVQNTTVGDNTKTGTLFVGVNGTTSRAIAINTTGGIAYIDTINFIAAGTVNAVVTGTVTALPSGTQNVSIVGQPVAISGTVTSAFAPSGTQDVDVVNTVTVGGTVSVSGTSNFIMVGGTVSTVLALPIVVVTASANPVVISGTVTDIPSGTQTVVFGATQPISGSVSVINTPTVTIEGTADVNLLAGTKEVGGIRVVAHQFRVSGYLSQTTASNAIIITSGAHTIYIQDLIISVETAMSITFYSAATVKLGPLYFATQGGTKLPLIQPMILNSNQSLTVTPSASGTLSVYAGGYTVT
jgi:hypothetical protein